jgi:hypothetical protein
MQQSGRSWILARQGQQQVTQSCQMQHLLLLLLLWTVAMLWQLQVHAPLQQQQQQLMVVMTWMSCTPQVSQLHLKTAWC